MLPPLHTGLVVSKSPEAKKAARGACAAIVAALGDGEFQSRVASFAPKSSADAFAAAGKDEEKSAKKVSAKHERANHVGAAGEEEGEEEGSEGRGEGGSVV